MSAALATLPRVGLKVPPAWVEFRGLFKVRLLLGMDEKRRVVVADVADAHGLQRQAFQARARRGFRKGCSMMEHPSAGGLQDILTLELKYLPALLLGIEASRVRSEVRPRLEEIQEELTEALAAYTFEGIAVNPAFRPALPAVAPDAAWTRALIREELDARDKRLREAWQEDFVTMLKHIGKEVRVTVEANTSPWAQLVMGFAVRLQALERSGEVTPPPSGVDGPRGHADPAENGAVPHLAALQALVSKAIASGQFGTAVEVMSAARKLDEPPGYDEAEGARPAVPERSAGARQVKERVTPADNRQRVLAFVREENAKEEGPSMHQVCVNVRGGTARVSRAVHELLTMKQLVNRAAGKRWMSLWIPTARPVQIRAPQGRARKNKIDDTRRRRA